MKLHITRDHLLVVCLLIAGIASLLMLPHKAPLRGKQPTTPATHRARSTQVTLVDARGSRVVVPAHAEKIISLAPNITEILFAIGAGNRVAGVTTFCDYPAEANRLPKVSDYSSPNQEKIAEIAPNLILAARGNSLDALNRLQTMGYPVVAVDATSLADVARDIRLIGRAVDEEEAANRVAESLGKALQDVKAKTARLPAAQRPRTLVLFSLDGGLFTAGPGSHIDELITLAGGKNIAVSTKKPWPELAFERMLAADPQVILITGMGSAVTTPHALAKLRADARWAGVSAVKSGRVVVLDANTITRPGPRLADGLQAMAAALHPELFTARKQ